jgi:hypothetical protein
MVIISSPIFGPLVGAAATLAGVLIVQRASKKRERESRLWDMRVDTYRDVAKWLLIIKVGLRSQGYVGGEALSAEYVTSFQGLLESLLPSDDLTASVMISASDKVKAVFTSSTKSMAQLRYGTFEYCTKNFGTFLYQISRLQESIRSEMAIREIGHIRRGGKWVVDRWRLFAAMHLGREEVFYKPSAELKD